MKVYTCELCGNVLTVKTDGGVIPECCGKEMTLSETEESDNKDTKDCGCNIK